MEKKMETSIMGYLGTTKMIYSFIPSSAKVSRFPSLSTSCKPDRSSIAFSGTSPSFYRSRPLRHVDRGLMTWLHGHCNMILKKSCCGG